MSSKTEPVFKLILFTGLLGVFTTFWGIIAPRDILALGGVILIAVCITSVVRLVK